MSHATERLAQTIEMVELMNEALRHLRKEVLPKNPRMFALMLAHGRRGHGAKS